MIFFKCSQYVCCTFYEPYIVLSTFHVLIHLIFVRTLGRIGTISSLVLQMRKLWHRDHKKTCSKITSLKSFNPGVFNSLLTSRLVIMKGSLVPFGNILK